MYIPLQKYGRRLVWHDEFDGKVLDADKWSNERLMDNVGTLYDNCEENQRVENGMLHLQVHKKNGKFTLSESVTTKYTMLFRYGYVEMRAKVPFRRGAWPSFWLKGDTPYLRKIEGRNNWFPEIDIFEIFSSENRVSSDLHKWGRVNGKPVHEMTSNSSKDINYYDFENIETLNDEFHIYGMLWDEHSIKFSVDGVCYYEAVIDDDKKWWPNSPYEDMLGFHDPHYLIINNEIFSETSGWAPDGARLTSEDQMPIDYFIDYVRLYQNEAEKIYQGEELEKAYELSK